MNNNKGFSSRVLTQSFNANNGSPKVVRKKRGRRTIFTEIVLQKLEMAFSYGCTDEEACIFADLAPSSLYNFQKQNPEFLERKRLLREMPILKARITVINNLDDPHYACWFLERKARDEFSLKQTVQHESLKKYARVVIHAGRNPYLIGESDKQGQPLISESKAQEALKSL